MSMSIPPTWSNSTLDVHFISAQECWAIAVVAVLSLLPACFFAFAISVDLQLGELFCERVGDLFSSPASARPSALLTQRQLPFDAAAHACRRLFLCQMVVLLALVFAWPLITFINYIIKSVIAGQSDHLVSGLCFSDRVIVSSWPKHPFSHDESNDLAQTTSTSRSGACHYILAQGVKQVTIVGWPPSVLQPLTPEKWGQQVSKMR